jgi:mono/diheme cytochrome c family protein
VKGKLWWLLLIVGFAVGSYWGQEKQPSKQEHPAAAATSASAPQAPHTYNISREDKERKNPVRFTDLSVERGTKLFQSQCAMCHGKNADGKGDLVEELDIHPPDFTKPDVLSKRTEGELFAIMSEGSGTMPGQNKRITERQRWQIVNCLRAVEGKTPAKATDKERTEEDTIAVSAH